MTFAANSLTSWRHSKTELFEGMWWKLSCLDSVYHSMDMIARQIEEIQKNQSRGWDVELKKSSPNHYFFLLLIILRNISTPKILLLKCRLHFLIYIAGAYCSVHSSSIFIVRAMIGQTRSLGFSGLEASQYPNFSAGFIIFSLHYHYRSMFNDSFSQGYKNITCWESLS